MRKVIGRVVGGKYLTDPEEISKAIRDNYDFSRAKSLVFHVPHIVTDSTFMKGWYSGDQFEKDPVMGQAYRAKAAAAGVSTQGKHYLHQLAESAGDPRAWIEGRGDIQKICEERGYSCDGAVKVRGPDHGPYEDPGTFVADDIVDNYVADQVEAQEGFVPTPTQLQDMRESARHKLTPNYTDSSDIM